MNTSKPIAMMVMAILCHAFIFAQDIQLTKRDSIVQSYWLVTVGANAVDDSGDEFGELFDFKEGWNMVPYPSRVSIGRYFKNGIGLEAIGSYNQYKEGKIIDNVVNPADVDYWGLDFRVSYDLNMILGEISYTIIFFMTTSPCVISAGAARETLFGGKSRLLYDCV